MNKVLIVDDEFPARELLKMAIDWEEAGFEIIGESKNGQEAYCFYQKEKPDLIITDIQMPVMDGIDLIRKVKAENPEQKFVILSCHESFQYAKMAIKLGVSDYLLKDSYTPEELYLLLRSMTDEKERLSEKSGVLKTSASDNLGKWLKNAVEGNMQQMNQLKEHFFKKGYSYYFAILLECVEETDCQEKTNIQENMCGNEKLQTIEKSSLPENRDAVAKCSTMEILETVEDIAAARIGENKVCVLGRLGSSPSFLQNFQRRFDSVVRLKSLLESRTWYKMSMGVSQVFQDTGHILRYYQEANKALDYMVFKGREKIIFYENMNQKREAGILEKLGENFKKLQNAVECRKKDEIKKLLIQIYEKDIEGMMQCNYLYYINSLLFGYLTYLVTRFNISLEQFYEEGSFSITRLNDMESCIEMEEWMYRKIKFILDYLEHEVNYSPIIRQAIEYLEENYSQDISIENVADTIGINKSYLSRTFKAEVGRNISVYLNELRISKALSLMDKREYKTMDIVYTVGYNSAQNYYHAFKQVMGVTPKEYRENRNRYVVS